MSQYIDADELKKALTLQGTSFADYEIGPAVTAASDAVNEVCGRKFDQDNSEDKTFYYSPIDPYTVMVNDLLSITSVFSDQNGDGEHEQEHIENQDFFCWPFNNVAQLDRPFTHLKLNKYRATVAFPVWAQRSVAVTGRFGWPEIPSFVPVATRMLASRLVKRMREAPFGIVTVGLDMGSAMRIARNDPDIMGLMQEYMREKVV